LARSTSAPRSVVRRLTFVFGYGLGPSPGLRGAFLCHSPPHRLRCACFFRAQSPAAGHAAVVTIADVRLPDWLCTQSKCPGHSGRATTQTAPCKGATTMIHRSPLAHVPSACNRLMLQADFCPGASCPLRQPRCSSSCNRAMQRSSAHRSSFGIRCWRNQLYDVCCCPAGAATQWAKQGAPASATTQWRSMGPAPIRTRQRRCSHATSPCSAREYYISTWAT
jgi:hypothetical protein